MPKKIKAVPPEQLIKRLLDAADGVAEEADEWPNDRSMQKMFANDADDMRAIAALLKKGDNKSAIDLAWEMDTAARDEIPKSVWLWWEKVFKEDFLTPHGRNR